MVAHAAARRGRATCPFHALRQAARSLTTVALLLKNMQFFLQRRKSSVRSTRRQARRMPRLTQGGGWRTLMRITTCNRVSTAYRCSTLGLLSNVILDGLHMAELNLPKVPFKHAIINMASDDARAALSEMLKEWGDHKLIRR